MVMKKKTSFGRDPSMDLDGLDDFDFASFDGGSKSSKQDKKRRPILKVTTNVAKGSLGHMTSESFIRSTLGRALPEGYSTAIEAGYEIRDTANQLYNTAATEFRKNAPAARRVVDRLLPKAEKFAPKAITDRLKRFVEDGKDIGYGGGNSDEAQLREVLAEFELANYQDRAVERAKGEVERGIQRQIDTRRFNTNIKALASIDARLAKLSAFNDQVFTRYQRRSLEVQYRQYFTMRDMLKLQGSELSQQRQLLSAIVHNTALPDGVKSKLREKYGEGLRERLSATSQQAVVGYTQNFFRNITAKLSGGIKNIGSGIGSGLDGMNMSAEMMDMMKANGMDVSGESQKMFGGVLASILTGLAAGTINGSFKRSGFSAQAGAKLGRHASTIPDMLQKWATSRTDHSGLVGSLMQMLKDQVPRNPQNKWLGSSFIQTAGDPGTFTKKTQRSIEEIMPGYLARILQELRMTRTGDENVASTMWSDDKGRFITSTHADRVKAVKEKIFNNRQMNYGRDRVKDFADDLTADRELSPEARSELEKAIMRGVISGRHFDAGEYLRGGNKLGIDEKYRKEIARAIRGRFSKKGGGTDQVTLGKFTRNYQALRTTVPDVKNMVSARMDLGQTDLLDSLGLIDDLEEGHTINYDAALGHMAGDKEALRRKSKASRSEPEYVGSEYGGMGLEALSDPRPNLYRQGMTVPTLEGMKILTGAYINAKTYQTIRLTREFLDGVMDAHTHRMIVTGDQAAKLVTASGETLVQFLARTQRKKGRLDRASDWVNGKVRGAAEGFDNFMDYGKGAKLRGKGRRGVRRQAQAHAAHAAQVFGQKSATAASSIYTTASTKVEGLGKEALAAAQATPFVQRAKVKAKQYWRAAVNAKRYAFSLYKSGKVAPVIESEALRAGEYVSATTGKVITDLRELAEGVKNKAGEWVATAQEVAEDLRTAQGTPFEQMMDDIQHAAESVGAEGLHASQRHTEKMASTLGVSAVQAAQNASADVPEHASPFTHAESKVDVDLDPLMKLITEFKDGNLQHLHEILGVVATRDFGGGAGDPNAAGPQSKYAKTRFGILGRWGGALTRGGLNTLRRGALGYGRYVKTMFGLQGKLLGGVARLTGGLFAGPKEHLGKVPSDVFVKGESKERLTKGKMMAGDYFNADGSPIRVPKDIKGIVKDAEGNMIIDAEDLRKGLTDRQGRSIVGRLFSTAFSGAVGLAGIYGKIVTAPFQLLTLAGRGIKAILDASKLPTDVYTKDDLETPKLRAFAMRAGHYIDKKSGATIRTVQDIAGPVMDTSGPKPILALSAADLKMGICDANGKPFKIKGSLLGGLLGDVVGLTGGLIRGGGRLLGSMAKAGMDMATAPFRLLSHLFGSKKGPGKQKGEFKSSDEQTHKLLGEVLRLLDARLPASEHYRSGSWQDILNKRRGDKSGKAGDGKKSDPQQSLWSKLFSRFNKDDDTDHDDDEKQGTNTEKTIYKDKDGKPINEKDAKGRKRGSWQRNREAAKRRRERAAGNRSGTRTGAGRYKPGGWRKWGAAALEKGKGLGGKLGSLKGGVVGILASLGLNALADSAGPDSTVGKVADVASTGLGIYGTVATLSSILEAIGAGGAVSAIGGGLATAASAVGGTIVAGASALAGLISLPVVLVAGAVAAVGTGIYYGYKYYSLKKKGPLRKYRMAQYGVDMNKDVWPAGKMQKLEEILLPHVKIVNGVGTIEEGKGIDYDAILKLFDLKRSWYNPVRWFHKTDSDDVAKQKAFLTWFTGRFRPVFLNWVVARDKVSPKTALSDLDDELKNDQKQTLLKAVHAMDASMFANMASPLGDDPLTADAKVVEAAYQEALKDSAKKGGSGSGGTVGKKDGEAQAKLGLASAGKATAALTKDGKPVATAGKVSTSLDGTGALIAATKDKNGKPTASAMLAAKSPSLGRQYMDNKASALTAVRYRTYGLGDLDTDKVKALFMLEVDAMDDVRYAGDGTARFEGDVSYYFAKFAGYFGVAVDDEKAKLRWYSWFAKRFIPTLLQFATAVKKANKTVNPLDADDYLSPQHLLDVANMTIAATFLQDGRTASVWTYTDSPFDDKPLNSSSDSTKPNLEALKQAVKSRQVAEEKAKEESSKNAQDIKDAAKKQNAAQGKDVNGRPNAANDPKYLTRQRLEASLPKGLEVGSKAADSWVANGGKPGAPVGVSIKQPGNGTAGDINKLPIPTGSGREAMAQLLAAVGKMTGVDPALLDIFAGIESSWNPSAAAPGSSARGLFQFVGSTWREKMGLYASKYGIDPSTSPLDPRAAALMGAEFIRENQARLTKALGRAPTDTELYLAHFLGPGGASKMLKAGDGDIAAAVAGSDAAAANPTIFYRSGQALTKASLMKLMDGKVAKFRKGGPTALASNYKAPDTGGVTTTTANGPMGGVGMATPEAMAQTKMAADGDRGDGVAKLGQVGPKGPSPKVVTPAAANDAPADDPIAQRQAAQAARAAATDRAAQVTAQTQQVNMGSVTDYLKKQLDMQAKIAASLDLIAGHTDKLATADPATASAAPAGPVVNPAPPSKVPPRQTAAMPQTPVSMERTKYG